MWRSVCGVLLLSSLPLSGCLSGETLPVADDVAPIAFMDGDRIDWAFEGTGTFRAVIQPGEHVNLRFRIEHDDIEEWCDRSHPMFSGGGFLVALLHPTDVRPMRNGAGIVHLGHTDDIQARSTPGMAFRDDCGQSDLIGVSSKTTATFFFATSVPGFRISVFDQHAERNASFRPATLTPFATTPAVQPTATADGVADGTHHRIDWTTEWRARFDVGPTLFLGMQWFDVDEDDPVNSVGTWRFHEFEVRIERTNDGAAVFEQGFAPMTPFSNYDGAFGAQAWIEEAGQYDFTWRTTETKVSPASKEGAWFVAIPLDA